MTPGDQTLIQLNRTLREAQGGTVTLPVSTVAWLEGLAQDAWTLSVTYDAHALDTVARFDAGPGSVEKHQR
jgi:hypothetical protein